jgi:hypothetical protein
MTILLLDLISRSRFTAAVSPEPIAVWLSSNRPDLKPLEILNQEIMVQRQRSGDVGLRRESHQPMRSLGRFSIKPRNTSLVISSRSAGW